MLKNKKKLRRIERNTPGYAPGYAKKTAQSLVLAGALVLGGAGVADAAWETPLNWGDISVSANTTTVNGDSLWRDGSKFPANPNNGNLTITGGTFTVTGNGTGATGTTVGNGNVLVQGGGLTINGGNLSINQGNLTFANNTTLTISSAHYLKVYGDVTAEGTLTSTLSAGMLGAENIRLGNNVLAISGTHVAARGGVFANSLNITSTGQLTADSVTATGDNSTITHTGSATIRLGVADFGTKTLTVANTNAGSGQVTADSLTAGALVVGAATTASSKVSTGVLNAGTVTIDGNHATNNTLILGNNGTTVASAEHNFTTMTITKGTLTLDGAAAISATETPAKGQTLKGNVALNAATGTSANSVLSAAAGTHTIDGDVTVASTKGGTITSVGTLNVNNIKLNGVAGGGNGATLVLDGTGTVNVTDTVKLDFGDATLTNGTLKVAGQDKLVMDATSKLTVTSGTLHVGGDYTHSMGAQTAGLVMDGGTLRADGKLTLTANTGASNTQTIDNTVTSAADTIKGSIVANTLHTTSSNAQGVTITKGSVQIMGKGVATGTDIYTTDVAGGTAHSIEVSANTGSLILGATKAANQGEGAYGGKVNTIVLNSGTAGLQFGHGNFTVGTLVANANGALSFNDDTNWSTSAAPNQLSLGTTANAFDAKAVSLGEGAFQVNGEKGLNIVNGGTAAIHVADAEKEGFLHTLTLAGTGKLDTANAGGVGNSHAGTYTIGTLNLAHADSNVIVDSGKVVTKKLHVNNAIAVATGKLEVSNGGTWVIENIDTTGSVGTITDFNINGGTLLIGQDITLAKDTTNTTTAFKINGAGTGYEVLDNSGTLGSTKKLTLTTNGGAYTVGAADGDDGGTIHSLYAQTLAFDATGALTVQAGKSVTVTGNGTSLFDKVTSVQLGNTSAGTLILGATGAPKGTVGGTYDNIIKVGGTANAADDGTLTFLGGDFTLSKLHLNTGANGSATVNLAGGSGKLTLTTTNSAGNSGVAGLVLAGNSGITDNVLNVGTGTIEGVHTEYEIVGGVTVTKGTVTFGNNGANAVDNINILRNTIVLNAAAVGNAVINIDGGINQVNSITATNATTATGTVNVNKGSLIVDSALDLSKALLTLGGNNSATLASTGTLTIGTLAYNAGAVAGMTNINNTGARDITLAAEKLVINNGTAASSITVNAGSTATNLNLEIGSGGITASDFNITQGTVNLLGTGGAITLSGASAELDVTGTNSFLQVGRAATSATDGAASSNNWSAGTVKLTSGALKVDNGTFKIANLKTDTASTIIVGNFTTNSFNPNGTVGTLIIDNAAFSTTGNNNLIVHRGVVQFGGTALPTDLAASMARNNADATLVVNKKVDLSNVTATFGDKLQGNVRPPNDKCIEFGERSLTYVNFDSAGTSATDYAIKTATDVYVNTGASLQVTKTGGLKNGDTVYLLETAKLNGVKGIWDADRVNTQSRLLNLNLTVDADRKHVTGTTSMNDINQTMPGISGSMAGFLMNMVNTVGEDVDSPNAGIRFASRVINRDFLASDAQAAPTIEGAAQMGAVAGVQVSTIGAASVASSAVTTRTSFAQPLMDMTKAVAVHQDNDGTLSLDTGLNAGNGPNGGMKSGLGVWIMPLYQSNKTWGQKAENFKSGMSSDLGGIALGADYTINDMFRFGAAFNVGGGYGQSSGDFNETENRFNFWGVNLYGGWAMNNFGVSADVGYTSSFNAVEQELPTSMAMGNLKADVTTSAWTAGLKGEYKFETSVIDIIPHVGVRYMGLTTDSYDVKSGGTVFGVERDFQSIWTFPIGVAFSKTIESDSGPSGWTFKPMVDLTIIPAAGDLDAKSKASIPGVGGNAEMKMQVVDAITYDGGVGFEVGKGDLSFGLNYNIQASEHRTGHGVFGTLRYEF